MRRLFLIAGILFSLAFLLPIAARADQSEEDAKRAIDILSQVIAVPNLDPVGIAQAYCERGRAYIELRDVENAVKDFEQVAKTDSKNYCGYEMQGFLFQAFSKHEIAIQFFQKAAAVDPKGHTHYLNIGNNYQSLNQFSEAREYYGKAIALKPDYAKAFYDRGLTYLYEGNFREGLKDFNRAVHFDPKYAEAWDQKAVAELSLGDIDNALTHSAKAIALNGKSSQAWSNRGFTLLKAKQLNAAIDAFNQSIAFQDENWDIATAYSNRSQALLFAGEYVKAEEDARHLIELDNKAGLFHRRLADALFAQGQFGEAARKYQFIISRSEPGQGWDYFHLELARRLGKLDVEIPQLNNPNSQDFYLRAYLALIGKSSPDWQGKPLQESSDQIQEQSEAAYYTALGMIEKVEGREEQANALIAKARKINPYIPVYWGLKP